MQQTYKSCRRCRQKTALSGQQAQFNPRSEDGGLVCPPCKVAEIIERLTK